MKDKIDALIRRDLQNGAFVGANAAVYREGECLYEGSFGLADREANTPMTFDSIFRIYSMTKPVTAAAALQMVEKGALHPDMPVSYFIPEFGSATVYNADGTTRPPARPILVQDLLNMTSGLCYPNPTTQSQKDTAHFFWEMEQRRDGENPVDTMEFCRGMARIPLDFDPGTHWEYGTSADVLAGVVQAVSGMDYRDYLRANILDPLGMQDTDFFVPQEKLGRFTAAYCRDENGALVRDDGCYLGLNGYRTKPAFISGGAGLCSTIRDYSRFAEALAHGGTTRDGVRILSEASVNYIRTPQVGGSQFLEDQQWDSLHGYEYGSLVRVLTDRAKAGTLATLGEFGWDGWTGTYFCVDPAEKLSIFFWIQVASAGFTDTAKLMRNVVYANLR